VDLLWKKLGRQKLILWKLEELVFLLIIEEKMDLKMILWLMCKDYYCINLNWCCSHVKLITKREKKNPVPTDEQVKQNFTCDIVPFHGKQKRIRARVITKEEHGSSAYLTLRKEQAKARKVGLPLRKKREETKKQDQQPSLSKKERKKVEKGQDKEE